MWRCLRDPTFSRFSRTPTCDRRTDRQTTTARVNTHSDVSHSSHVSHRARSEALKTDQSRFQAARRTGQPNLALIFLVFVLCYSIFQFIGANLLLMGRKTLTQSINQSVNPQITCSPNALR